jgi:predicted MFS family arabinose efflux permease
VPLGGYLASRWRRPDTLIVLSTAIGGAAVLAIPFTSAYVVCFSVIGLILFLPAGIMAALPIEVLRPENRATGLGLFYTWWYAGVAGLPPVGGWTYDVTGSAAAPLLYAAALVFLTLAALGLFRFFQRTPQAGLVR